MKSFLTAIDSIWRPHGGQKRFLLNKAKIKVLACGRRWGKTDACAVQIAAALQEEKPTRHLILAPTLDQATLLFDRVLEMLDIYERCSPPLREGREGELLVLDRRLASGVTSPGNEIALLNPPSRRENSDPAQGQGGQAKPAPKPRIPRVKKPKDETQPPEERKPRTPKPKPEPAEPKPKAEKPKRHIRRTPYPSLKYRGHRVTARSGHIGRALRGNEATHIVVDEAAFVPEELVTEVAMPMLATTNGSLTLISTPNGHNHFWRFYQMGRRRHHKIWSRSSPSSENPQVSQDFLAIQRDLISERAFAIEYEAQFFELQGRVFGQEAIEACLEKSLPTGLRGPIVIGVDWGRRQDFTAVTVLCGTTERAYLIEAAKFTGDRWEDHVRKVASIVCRYPSAPVYCDGTATQDSIVEMLQRELPHRFVKPVDFKPNTKRAALDRLQGAIEQARLRFEADPALLTELEHYEFKSDGKTGARGSYHDDLISALLLAVPELPHRYRGSIVLVGERDWNLSAGQFSHFIDPGENLITFLIDVPSSRAKSRDLAPCDQSVPDAFAALWSE